MKIDPIWIALENSNENFETFRQRFLPEIYINENVHSDVKEHFRIIKRLIECSYFEYKFYDVAYLQSMLTMEMALKLRYEELNNIKWPKNKNLDKLIKWFEENLYFEVYNSYYLKSLKDLRNTLAHPTAHRFSGPMSRHIIQEIVDLINGLYEDPLLRKERMDLTKQILNKLESFRNGLVCSLGDITFLVFKAWPSFINNKIAPKEIHFYYKPCYKIPEPYIKNGLWNESPTNYYKAEEITISEDAISLKDSNHTELIISPIKSAMNQVQFNEWMNEYDKFSQPTGDHLFTHSKIANTFIEHLREFQRM